MYGRRVPTCFYECYDENKERLDPIKFYLYRRAQQEEIERQDWIKIVAALEDDARDEVEETRASANRSRASGRKRKYDPPEERIYRDPADGSIKKFGPCETEWYRMYVESPNIECMKFRKKFRRRFRCSYLSFQKHLKDVSKSDLFKTWAEGACNAVGNPSSPIELLVLGALRYIGRGPCLERLCGSPDIQ